MNRRLDALAPRSYVDKQTGETRSAFTRVGSAWENDNGGWNVELHAMPAPDPERGSYRIVLMEPRDDNGNGGGRGNGGQQNRQNGGQNRGNGGGGGQGRQNGGGQRPPQQQEFGGNYGADDDIPY